MYEGKPLLLVIGGSDTGRTPITAGLLRKALGMSVIVQTAGVLSHAGESAATEAQMALEQIGIDISRHVSRPLDDVEHHTAELLLAVDRGTELVLFTRFPKDPRIACLPVLANTPDVLDPHRMPLGVWVAVVRQIEEQVSKALPALRQQLGVTEYEPAEQADQPAAPSELLGWDTKPTKQWDNDEDMQRLMRLINDGQAHAAEAAADPATNGATDAFEPGEELRAAEPDPQATTASTAETPASEAPKTAEPAATEASTTAQPETSDAAPAEAQPSRADHVTRMGQMLEAAGNVPEIIDWQRLRQELITRLRAVAQQPVGATDFAPAAALMIEGKLMQQTVLPNANALYLLQRSIARLKAPLKATQLAAIGNELAQW